MLLSKGGALGIAVAYWCTRVLPRWASQGAAAIPLNLTPDARILIFSVTVAIATGVLCGFAPALQSAHVDPASTLKVGVQSIPGRDAGSRWPMLKLLVAAQVALSLVLLVGAGMFLKTLQNYSQLNPGFDRNHLLNAPRPVVAARSQTGPLLYDR